MRGGLLVSVLVAVLLIGASASSASVYRGVMTNGAGLFAPASRGLIGSRASSSTNAAAWRTARA